MSWRHTGFSVDNSIIVYPSDEKGLERLARYMIRSPVNLKRLHYLPQTQQVFYQTNKGHDQVDSEIIAWHDEGATADGAKNSVG